MSVPTPQREPILASLERLLAWPEIARSQQLARFLEYIVQRTLAGDEASIKAYSIAVDVLGRSADFDPQSDPIVRVQARRLRGLLDEDYRGPGSADPVRIGLPVGRYVPEFSPLEDAVAANGGAAVNPVAQDEDIEDSEDDAKPGRRAHALGGVTLSWFALVVILLAMAVASFAFMTFGPISPRREAVITGPQQPSVTVIEFQNLTGPDNGAPKVAGLAIELVTDLDQFDDLDVRYGGGGDVSITVADGEGSDYVLSGIVRRDGALVQYSAILTDSTVGVVVWNHTIAVPAASASDVGVLDDVSRRLSLILGSPRGPMHIKAREALAQSPNLNGGGNLYLCRMLFSSYRETGMAVDAAYTDKCLASLPSSERETAVGLAIAGSLLAEQGIGAGDVPKSRDERLRQAEAQLDRAISLSPVSAFIWEEHARLRLEMGQIDRARADYGSAIQLNPANGDALAGYARVLAFGGQAAQAEILSTDAVEGTPNPPDWYFGVPALLALRSGNFEQAIEHAGRYAQVDHELGPILAILAGQRAGDGEIVNRYLAQVLDVSSFRTVGVLPRLLERVQDVALLEQIRGSLTAAGVPPQALNGPF